MGKQGRGKEALKEAGLCIRCKDYEELVKEFNNREMPLGQRVQQISENPEEFIEFVKLKKGQLDEVSIFG